MLVRYNRYHKGFSSGGDPGEIESRRKSRKAEIIFGGYSSCGMCYDHMREQQTHIHTDRKASERRIGRVPRLIISLIFGNRMRKHGQSHQPGF